MRGGESLLRDDADKAGAEASEHQQKKLFGGHGLQSPRRICSLGSELKVLLGVLRVGRLHRPRAQGVAVSHEHVGDLMSLCARVETE